jgi:hypothetical protein
MEEDHIISEIRRTAKANGGVVLGSRRFGKETGIRYHDWYGRIWIRWVDAVREAGFEPNRKTEAYDDELLLQKLVLLTRRLERVPLLGDLLLAAKNDPTFPCEKVFRRLGSKPQRASRILAFCEANPGHDDVAAQWRQITIAEPAPEAVGVASTVATVGYVYLLKHGSRREYKIGRTYNPLRREGEVGIELPEKLRPIHYIETDDPVGIEKYWHTRFAIKRKKGEWFALSAEDVRAFKRWKRIY